MSDVTVSISLTKKEQVALYMAHLDAKKTIKKLVGQRDELLGALKYSVDNEEQHVFEVWLQRTTPSGDCDSVHSQWLESSDYEDFCSAWEKQLSAIAKATA